MKIKDLLRILQVAPDKEKEVWMPDFEGTRTTYIDFHFDLENNLDLYAVIKEVEPYTFHKIEELEKLSNKQDLLKK